MGEAAMMRMIVFAGLFAAALGGARAHTSRRFKDIVLGPVVPKFDIFSIVVRAR